MRARARFACACAEGLCLESAYWGVPTMSAGAKPLHPESEAGVPGLFLSPAGPIHGPFRGCFPALGRSWHSLSLVVNCARWSRLVRAPVSGLHLRPVLFFLRSFPMKRRFSVSKAKSAKSFRHQVGKTKLPNMVAVQRGGIRL